MQIFNPEEFIAPLSRVKFEISALDLRDPLCPPPTQSPRPSIKTSGTVDWIAMMRDPLLEGERLGMVLDKNDLQTAPLSYSGFYAVIGGDMLRLFWATGLATITPLLEPKIPALDLQDSQCPPPTQSPRPRA
ncbi:uncharacterized protein STEHIDRAFT_112297 [Stereum hirsutum FP-91666 SS1]|uniref:uncharacterized protein n=1 Tax=Stereum hirsutum (strain FP-91666) TaxID=721885 RepID=UPI0004449D17|nr:uncharacterized protein STEHIDRAFT_112297 [Stereum hirsutum FP-91666 SS1]EIM84723.1 hypothetical protein STEHIDRAFT_112297 [Stereum hirsutum FP-91666 SS1]